MYPWNTGIDEVRLFRLKYVIFFNASMISRCQWAVLVWMGWNIEFSCSFGPWNFWQNCMFTLAEPFIWTGLIIILRLDGDNLRVIISTETYCGHQNMWIIRNLEFARKITSLKLSVALWAWRQTIPSQWDTNQIQ